MGHHFMQIWIVNIRISYLIMKVCIYLSIYVSLQLFQFLVLCKVLIKPCMHLQSSECIAALNTDAVIPMH